MKTITNQLSNLAAAIVLLAVASSTWAQTYTIQIISPPAGTASFTALNLNNLGQVVGSTKVKVGKNTTWGPAFIWANGQAKTLPVLSGQASTEATGISDSNLIVGGPTLFTSLEAGRATWWEKTPTAYQPHDWNVLPGLVAGVTLLRANSLSHDGRYIAFQANIAATGLRDIVAEIQLDATGLVPLSFVGFWDVTSVWGILDNSHNDVTGVVRAVGLGGPDLDTPGAFLWLKELDGNTQLFDLHSPVNQDTEAWGVNGLGEVAGLRRNSGVERAVYWNQSGVMQDIGTLGGTEATARSINDAGRVVGWATTGGRKSVSHAFLWDSSTGMRDLNVLKSSTDTSSLELTSAAKINNAGQILAGGTSRTLGSKIVLLNPVPAP